MTQEWGKQALLQELTTYYDSRNQAAKTADAWNFWVRYLRNIFLKVHTQSWNDLGCAVGLPRTGKSIFATFSCWLLNRNFDMTQDIVYTAREFSERMESIKRPGETIIWDEAGVGMPAREWFKIQNREIGKMLQSAGHLRPIVFFATPDFSFIDSQPKKLFHHFYECQDRNENYVRLKPYSIRILRKTGKVLFAYPRFLYEGISRIKLVRFYKPPEEFIKQYEDYSDPRKREMRKKSGQLMKEKVEKWDIPAIKAYILANPNRFVDNKGNITWKPILTYFQSALRAAGNSTVQAQVLSMELNRELKKPEVKVDLNERRTEDSSTN